MMLFIKSSNTALYTPIANFSLSGWIFLVVMIIGGWSGNVIGKRIKS